MTYFAFIDESGDHGMQNIDPASPMFALSAVVYPREDYIAKEIASLGRTKVVWWGHEGVIFRSYDIRKKQGPFAFCAAKEARESFQAELCEVFKRSSGKIISAVIDKHRHGQQYIDPSDPYYLAVQFVLERIGMLSGGRAVLVFESRGRIEDKIVAGWCERIAAGENYGRQKYQFTVKFAKKCDNVAGLQMADLACTPIIHYVQNPDTKRPDWLAVRSRMRSDWRGRIEGRGLKVFPPK
jgi:hypothetical protein